MEEKKVSTLFEEMKDELADYVSKRLRLFKLQSYSRTSRTGALLLYSIGIILLVVLALSFIFTTLALYLGRLLDSLPLGFGIVSLLTLLFVIVIIKTKKSIVNSLTNMIVSFLVNDDKE